MDTSRVRQVHRFCENHLTNSGSNNRAQIRRLLAERSDYELAQTLYRNDPLFVPGKISTYCEADELEPIFAELRANFPDWLKR